MSNNLHEINLNIIDNALDYITSGVTFFGKSEVLEGLGKGIAALYPASNPPIDYKYALINIASGMELILKARLELEHWSLIFDSIDNASKQKLKNGNFTSVSFVNLLNRLQNICDVRFSDIQIKELKEFKNLRNKLEHYQLTINVFAIGPKIASMMNFLLNFITQELEVPGYIQRNDQRVVSIKRALSEITIFVEKRLDYVLQDLRKLNDNKGLCPVCKQVAINNTNGSFNCHFCLSTFNYQEYIDVYLKEFHYAELYESKARGGFDVTTFCPKCGKPAFIKEENSYKCINCFSEYGINEISSCEKCGERYLTIEGNLVCQSCINGFIDT